MNHKVFFLILNISILLTSCSSKLDGTSLETLRSSADEMKKGLSITEQNRLDYFMTSKENGFIQLLTYKDFLKNLDGKTYKDLEKLYGDSLDKKCRTKIPILKNEINTILESKKVLDSVKIQNSKAHSYINRYSYLSDYENSFDFKVVNKCSEGLKRIFFNIYFIDKNNNDTLINEKGNYAFDYPLKGSKEISASPGAFSELDSKMNPTVVKETDFIMEVTGIETKTYEYDDYIKKELQELENELKRYQSYITN